MEEIWKDIEGYGGMYQVSNFGRIRSSKKGNEWRVCIGSTTKRGYCYAHLSDGTTNKKVQIHRLVAMAFVDGYRPGLVVNHKDENPSNNKAGNLEWTTQLQNMHSGTIFDRKCERNSRRMVLQITPDGEIVGRYYGVNGAHRATGVGKKAITDCCRGLRKMSDGFYWQYAEKESGDIVPRPARGVTIADSFQPLDGEEWCPVAGYEGLYEVSSLGRVRSSRNWKINGGILRGVKTKHYNYWTISLCKDGERKRFFIHRLVAKAFVEGYQDGYEVNHIDENSANNRADNLQWVSVRDNRLYGTRLERTSQKTRRPVLQYTLSGQFIAEHQSLSAAAAAIGRQSTPICNCCKAKQRTAFGYMWKYKEKE